MNALNLASWEALAETFSRLNEDESLRCILLRGATDRAFSAGADIAELAVSRGNEEQARRYDAIMRQGLDQVAVCRHPVIARISGACLGAGLVLAAQCDLRLAGRGARFGVPAARLSVVMPLPEMAMLQALVGPARMLEILLEGRLFSAADALSMGLVHRVVDEADLDAEVMRSVDRIAANSPLSNRAHKALVRRLDQMRLILPDGAPDGPDHFSSQDFTEGLTAFLEKRDPDFSGK